MSMSCCFTAKDKGEKKLFGYSFVPLMQEDGRTLPDGTHELIIHKVRPAYPHYQDFEWVTWNRIDCVLWQCTAEIFLQICNFIQDWLISVGGRYCYCFWCIFTNVTKSVLISITWEWSAFYIFYMILMAKMQYENKRFPQSERTDFNDHQVNW